MGSLVENSTTRRARSPNLPYDLHDGDSRMINAFDFVVWVRDYKGVVRQAYNGASPWLEFWRDSDTVGDRPSCKTVYVLVTA